MKNLNLLLIITAIAVLAIVAGCSQQAQPTPPDTAENTASPDVQQAVSNTEQAFVDETSEVQIGEML